MTKFPKLRGLEAFPVDQNGKRMVAVRDPLGILQGAAVLTPEAFFIASCFDGERSTDQAMEEFSKRTGLSISVDIVEALLEKLDQHFLLENERFKAELQRQIEGFAGLPTRAAFHAGAVYPKEAEQAKAQIEEMLQKGNSVEAPSNPVALLAPHIDFFRGGDSYGKSYRALKQLKNVERFVVLGTCHSPTENLLCLTRKDYETPFGSAQTDKAFVDALAKKLPGRPFQDEFCHRSEHSVEFQIHFLKYLFPKIPVVPILCGSLSARLEGQNEPEGSQEIEKSVAALREVLSQNKNSVLILGVDFAHVGPRFGNPPELTPEYLQQIEKEDRGSLEHIAKLDSKGFFHSVVDGGDPRNVCGLAPIYIGLRALEKAKGQLLDYKQCTSEDQSVTIAGMVFSKR